MAYSIKKDSLAEMEIYELVIAKCHIMHEFYSHLAHFMKCQFYQKTNIINESFRRLFSDKVH